MSLRIKIPKREFLKSDNTFFYVNETELVLEHSLVSLTKWESIYHKPFFSDLEEHKKTNEETLGYIKCMTLSQNVDPIVYKCIPNTELKKIEDYINDPMTATTVKETKKGNKEILTSEIMYYYMISLGIPFECQKWHLNKLITLMKVCAEKNNPRKMSRKEILQQNQALNAARRAKFHI